MKNEVNALDFIKEASDQELQPVIRALRSNSPVAIDPALADQAIVKLIRARVRFGGGDGSPIVKHGRMILREMGEQV